MRITVTTPSRLHLGIIDLNTDLGRIYGGLGVALERPNVVLEASPAKNLTVSGKKSDTVKSLAKRFLKHFQIKSGAHIHVEETIPEHMGLGSTTQLSLAVASALAKIYKLDTTTGELAKVMGRGKFSSIGTAAFERGGFVVDGGRKLAGRVSPGALGIPPVIVHLPFPEQWLFVVAVLGAKRGLNEREEKFAFERLHRAPPELADRICRLVLMKMLPSLLEDDLANFGSALTEVQRLVGDSFKAVQGGTFSSPVGGGCVKFMLKNGACG